MSGETTQKGSGTGGKKHKCIYSGDLFDSATGEHILQNFLGARWTDSTIVCDSVQRDFGKTIDSAFEEGVRPIRTLMGTKSGRRDDPPPLKGLSTTDGQGVDLKPGGVPVLSKPYIKVGEVDNGATQVSISLDPKHAGWAAAELKKKFPQVEVTAEELLKRGTEQNKPLSAPVHIQIKLGGPDYIRGVLKAAFNLLAALHIDVLDSAFDPVREFILKGTGRVEDFFRWPIAMIPNPPRLGPIDHFIGIKSNGPAVTGVFNLFGYIPHSLRFATNYRGPQFKVGYLVDPLRSASPAEERSPIFSDAAVIDFDKQALKPGPEVWATYYGAFTCALNAYITIANERIRDEKVKTAIDKALGKLDGRVLTKNDTDTLTTEFLSHLRDSLEEQ